MASNKVVSSSGRFDKGEDGFGPDVTPSNPCPACGKPDWCSWFADGQRVYCRRPDISGHLGGKCGKGGGKTFRLDKLPGKPAAPTNVARAKAKKPGRDQGTPGYSEHVSEF